MPVIVMGILVTFVAGLIQGCTGFGLALVLAPCLLLYMPQQTAVPVVILLSLVNTVMVAWQARRHIRPRVVLPLALGGALGLPLGIYFLTNVDETLYKAVAGTLITLIALALLLGWRKPVRNQAAALVPVGIASGALGGSLSIGGPPAILFLSNQEMEKNQFRANIVTYFVLLNCFAIAMFGMSGLISRGVLTYSALFIAPLVLGTWCGCIVSGRIPEKAFRVAATILVAVIGFHLAWRSIAMLL